MAKVLMGYLKSTGLFIGRLYVYRSMIMAMALREVKSKYAGTMLGVVWSVAQPLVLISIYWFVFSVGFRIQPTAGIPFVVVFLCGLAPWTVFSETLVSSTNAITENAHLVKKTVFPTEILPVVHFFAGMISHFVMLLILMVLMFFYRIPVWIWSIQFLYYLASLWVFTIALSWFLSALNVFYRDTGQTVGAVLTMWFWLTPIVWSLQIMPDKYHFLIMLNPMFYIIDGYKQSFLYSIPFWHEYKLGIYFWVCCITILFLSSSVFRKLKHEFAEVL